MRLVLTLALLCAAGAALARQATVLTGPQAVAAPVADEACFSPDEPCAAKLVRFVLGARRSLDVAVYDINLDELVQALAQQAPRLRVRIVVDWRQSRGPHSQVETLARLGMALRFGRQRGIMHNKFIVRDEALVETGSFNFTNHAATANSENQIYLATPTIVRRYVARFERIWTSANTP